MRNFFILVPLVSSDICQDFCTQQVGSDGCYRGSYCEKDYDCQGLFWTSAEQFPVCVYTGRDDECSNRFPVLCREAASRLSERSADMTSSPVTTVIPPTTSAMTTVDSSGGIVSVPAEHLPSLLARDNVTPVKLYFHLYFFKGRRARSHPYVRLSFLNEGRNLGYFAVFDTGSHRSYTFVETYENPFNQSHIPMEPRDWIPDEPEPIIRAAEDGEAYRQNPSIVPRNPRILQYGRAARRFPTIGSIPENIRTFSGASSFTFHEPRLHLVPPPGDRKRVLLGASRSSSFAAAAGAFAIIPSRYADIDFLTNWQLLIGQNSTIYAQMYCRHDQEPIQWYNMTGTTGHTAVEGLIWLGASGSSRQVVQRVEIMIDTGAKYEITLTPLMMDAVVAKIESFGPRRIPSNSTFPRFENCTESSLYGRGDFLDLNMIPGSNLTHDNPLSFRFSIRESIKLHHRSQRCTLKWIIGAVGGRSDRLVIGTGVLSKLVTVFDHTNQRVGFCRRSRTPII